MISPPGLPPRHYTPPVNDRRWIIALVAILTAAVVGGSYAWYNTRDNSKARALEYARQACAAVGTSVAAEDASTTNADRTAANATGWQTAADNAARAARLDPAWNELARAMDVQARAWTLSAQLNGSTSDQLAAVQQEIGEHPVDPECRKATVS